MRRFLTWIARSTVCASLVLVGIRTLRSTPSPITCIQLLAPATGDVLTLDVTTGAMLFDARTSFPLPLLRPSYHDTISPDAHHVLDAVNVSEAGPSAYRLWIGKRSTAYRRELTRTSQADQFLWSPDSKHLAFTSLRGWGAQGMLLDLTIVDADGNVPVREAIPEALDNFWIGGNRDMSWSPDGSTAAIILFNSAVGATLALRPVTAPQSIFVSFPNEQIDYLTWSPSTQAAYVFTRAMMGTQYKLYVIGRDGQRRHQTALAADFAPTFVLYELQSAPGLRWSPDGRYFYLFSGTINNAQLDIFDLDGNRLLPAPLSVSPMTTLWSTQPHTLIYVQPHAADQSLLSLDVATQQTTALVASFPGDHRLWLAPDSTTMLVSERTDTDHILPHLLSLDLTKNETPFGVLPSRGDVSPQWSPDNQKMLLNIADDRQLSLLWRLNSTGEIKRLDFPKQPNLNDGGIYPWWLSNDRIGLTVMSYTANTRKLLVINESSLQILPLSTTTADNAASVSWYDAGYVAVSTFANLTVYRLTDGTTVFSDLPPAGGLTTLAMEPYERALLIYRGRDASVARSTLTLTTHTSDTVLSDSENLTLPAWSPDGETFAFAVNASYGAGWTLQVMSRDGTPLRSFALPIRTNLTPYQQVHWTNCR